MTTINIKYELGDCVFCLHEQKVRAGRVVSILINKSGIKYTVELYDPKKPELKSFSEDTLMGSKEDLLEYIEHQFDELMANDSDQW